MHQALQDEMVALRDSERKIEAWAWRLAEIDRVRVTYQHQQGPRA